MAMLIDNRDISIGNFTVREVLNEKSHACLAKCL